MSVSKKRLKVLLNFVRFADGRLLTFGRHILQSMLGNLNFPRPPIKLDDLKEKLDNFSVLLAEAIHRDTRVIAQKNNVREGIINDLRMLATYVETEADDNEDAFTSSGFDKAPTFYAGAKPLGAATIERIEQGITGQLLLWIASLGREARSYQVRFGEDGSDPESWSIRPVTSVQEAISFEGLTPGKVYAFQVRAHGRLGFTNWSDSATRMCI